MRDVVLSRVGEVKPASGAGRGAAWLLPSAVGLLAGMALVGLYAGLVTWAQGFSHARSLMWDDRYWVAAIAAGFGLQAGLFVYVRGLVSVRSRGPAAAATAAGTGTSSVAMVACCAHHVTDALPILGLSGAAIFLNDYRVLLMALGLAVNVGGVALMLRIAMRERRRATSAKEASCEAGPS